MTPTLHRVVMWSVLVASACGRSSAPPASKPPADAAPGQMLDLQAMEADAAMAPDLEVPYQLPTVRTIAARPATPALHVFVTGDGAMRAGAGPRFADATEVADVTALRKLLPGDPGTGVLDGSGTDWGTLGTGSYGPLGAGNPHGQGYGVGIGNRGGAYDLFRFRGVRTSPAEARVLIVADRGVPVETVAAILSGTTEPYAVAVRGATGAIGALALPLVGVGGGGSSYQLTISAAGSDLIDTAAGTARSIAAKPDGGIDRDQLHHEIAAVYASKAGTAATIAIQLDRSALLDQLAAALDATAAGTQPVPVIVRSQDQGRGLARTNAPQVREGMLSVVGELDKNIIRRYVRRSRPKIVYCYEKQLVKQPALAGTVTVDFVITPQGTVASTKATGLHPDVASCVAGVIHQIAFPHGRAIVKVTYPFTFDPPTP